MYKLAWGTKKTCQECESRFYDLGKTPAVCPKCGAVNEIATNTRRKSSKKVVHLEIVTPEILEDDDTTLDDDTLLEDEDDDDSLDLVVESGPIVDDEDA